jgi:uncharacterized membrane protein YhhN
MNIFLIGVSILAALGYGALFAGRPDKNITAAVVKTAAVAALAALALSFGLPWLVIGGLALGAAGDFALARKSEGWFLAGLAAFAVGHLAYLIALSDLPATSGTAVWLVWGMVGLLVLWTILWLAPKAGNLRWPVGGYGVIIGAMLGFALTLAPGMLLLKTGAVLFTLSDLLLSLRLFVVQNPRIQRQLDLLLWPAYWGGQALILWGFVQAMAA